jgi:SAM-dependent methyltransferase
VGIDYSEAMVSHCRSRFPGQRFEVCDARDLGRFAAGSFSFTVFSFNGIGTIDHPGRLRTLAEIARVLEPGGIFAFSAHNRGYAAARVGPRLRRSRNPLTQAQLVFDWLRKTRNHARLRPFESDQPEYALVNDQAEGFTLLHYYVSKDEQRRQLEHAGLDLLEMYDKTGNPIAVDGTDQHTPWIWYVARKPGGSVSPVR